MGDQVAEGDILAEYDLEDLQRLAQESKLLLAQKQSELDRLTQQKTDADAQLQQKIDQLRASGSEQKSAEQEALETEKQTLKNQLNGHRQTEQTARQEAEELLDKQQQRAQVIADCDSRLSQLEGQRAQLQQELDGLIAQGAPDEQLQEARRKLAQNEVDIADVQRTRDEAAAADYEGQAAEKQRQADEAKSAGDQVQSQLDQAEQKLRESDEARQALRQEEDRQIETLRQQAAADQTTLESQRKAAELERDKAQKSYDELLQLCNDPTLRADRPGIVTALGGTSGTAADPATPLAKIGDETQRSLVLQIDPVDVGQVQPGQALTFYVDAYPEATFSGTVQSVSKIQNDAGKFEVSASFEPGEQPLYDGMGANATLIIKEKKDVLTVSNKAIQFDAGESYVFLADENNALRRQPVTTGFSNGRLTEIQSGLKDGDVVLVEEVYKDQ
ncbi:efflux RND transporter periplasmic adaptor subunit [Allofournierella massiliensis]|uniref:efflux RND transporter periplasmic adaptor subunit n=1 Tax=Allofournierella massiliensis TaxID=1650663 RepID=UPI0023F52CBD|nr:efflux RND transporter periplasmic adaptor subunit [Fournierella massiliensis]